MGCGCEEEGCGCERVGCECERVGCGRETIISCAQVEKKIGQGQFSVVYRARNLVNGEIVALKKIQVCLGTRVGCT